MIPESIIQKNLERYLYHQKTEKQIEELQERIEQQRHHLNKQSIQLKQKDEQIIQLMQQLEQNEQLKEQLTKNMPKSIFERSFEGLTYEERSAIRIRELEQTIEQNEQLMKQNEQQIKEKEQLIKQNKQQLEELKENENDTQ